MMTKEEVERRFIYHPPTEETRKIHDEWRTHILWLAERVNQEFEDSREKSLIMTSLEETSFWIHAHIARNITPQ